MSHQIFVVTGLSGSGKTSTLKVLEDLGCEVIDNLPISLCPLLVQQKNDDKPLALGIDLRTRDFSSDRLRECITHLKQQTPTKVVFLEASERTIVARYRETRRMHPLGSTKDIEALILEERNVLADVREEADVVFDTTTYCPPEIRHALQQILGLQSAKLKIYLLSFSFRIGPPQNSDFLFDMRFLSNPHYQKDIKFLTGQTIEIQEYLKREESFQTFLQSISPLFSHTILPKMQKDGRCSTVIGFGCTGGRHRSVGTAEIFSQMLKDAHWDTKAFHRDL